MADFGGEDVVAAPQALTQAAQQKLKALVTRIETLEQEKAGIAADIKEIYAEAKGVGYDVKVLRKVIARRKQDPRQRAEFEQIMDLYLLALGEI
ncbi:MAG: DUF2312 domain-containing protein [Hyphomonadaceae bacterium]|nr:DUF2312 domain-containing protein [Hyphomonadaceae bacterium]